MLIFIMGKSGSGKNYTYHSIMNSDLSNILKPHLMYTTRPIRPSETDGVDMNFCSEGFFDHLRQQDELLEERKIDKVDGTYYYGTRKIDPISAKLNNYILPEITPECYFTIKSFYDMYDVKTLAIVLESSDLTRMYRLIRRRDNNSKEEMKRRMEYDNKIFDEFEEKIKNRSERNKNNHPIIFCLNTRVEDQKHIIDIIKEWLRYSTVNNLPDYYYKE